MRIEQAHYQFELLWDRVASNDRPDFMPWEKDEFLNNAQWLFLEDRYQLNKLRKGFEVDQLTISELSNLHIKSPELQPVVTPINLGNGRYEVRLDDLGNNINGQYFRYLFLTKAEITIIKNGCSKKVRLKLHQTDDLKTTFNQPDWNHGVIHGQFGKSTFPTPPTPSTTIGDSLDRLADLIENPTLVTERFNNDQLQSLYIDTTDVDNVQQFDVTGACISYIKYPNRVFIGGYDHIDKQSTSSTPQIQFDIDEAFHPKIVKIAVDLAKMANGEMGQSKTQK
jgi:hypothetical protein